MSRCAMLHLPDQAEAASSSQKSSWTQFGCAVCFDMILVLIKFEAKIFTEGRWRSMKMTAILPETLQGVAVSCRFFQWADKLIFDSQHLREAERGRETSLSNPRP